MIKVSIRDGGRYAPGMYILRPKSRRHVDRIIADMLANGCPEDDGTLQEETVLISEDEIGSIVHARALRDLRAGWDVTVMMDPWDVRHMYGWARD